MFCRGPFRAPPLLENVWFYLGGRPLCENGLNPTPPSTVTDCKGILTGLQAGPLAATKPDKKLARTWQLVRNAIDDDFNTAADMLTWMPAHGSTASIHSAVMSNGSPVSPLYWRANRLVDLLAKTAACEHRLPKTLCKFVEDSAKLVQHHAARLACATKEANGHAVSQTQPDGTVTNVLVRDSTATGPPRTTRKRGQRPAVLASDVVDEPAPGPSCATELDALAGARSRTRRPAAKTRGECSRLARLREDKLHEEGVARWLASRQLSAATGPSAADRREALLARVALKNSRASGERVSVACNSQPRT